MREKYNKKIENQSSKSLVLTIDNFRVFNTPTTFELAPITILTGPNNSGKSSLVKALLMLRNNSSDIPYEVKLPNKNLDLPKAMDVLNDKNKPFAIAFSMKNIGYEFDVQIAYNQEDHDSNFYFNSITIKNKNRVILQFDDFNQLSSKSIINVRFWLDYIKKDASTRTLILNKFSDRNDVMSTDALFEIVPEDELLGSVSSSVKKEFDKRYEQVLEEINSFILLDLDVRLMELLKHRSFFELDSNQDFLEVNYCSSMQRRLELIFKYHLQFELMKKVEENILGNFKILPTEIYKSMDDFCKELPELIAFELSKITDMEVLPISKSKQSRYFQSGESGNSFLADAAIHFFEMGQLDYNKYYEFKLWICSWLERFEIGSSIDVKNIESKGIYTIELIDKNAKKRNLKDYGYGVSQIVTLLLSPYKSDFVLDTYQSELNGVLTIDKDKFFDKQPMFYLEEPESNLHPNWQSLLMELIVDINQRFGIRFIIETHSEYMIRKLQYLMADKTRNLHTKDALVYYFNSDKNVNESEGEPKIKKISLDKSGSLSDNFGPGFYDEAINLEYDLLKLKNYQSN